MLPIWGIFSAKPETAFRIPLPSPILSSPTGIQKYYGCETIAELKPIHTCPTGETGLLSSVVLNPLNMLRLYRAVQNKGSQRMNDVPQLKDSPLPVNIFAVPPTQEGEKFMLIRPFVYALLAFSFAFPVASSAQETAKKAEPAPAAAKPAVPRGATALCKDGSYSFVKNSKKACAKQGGIDQWLKKK